MSRNENEDPSSPFGAAKLMAALLADVRESQALGMLVDQAYVNRLAKTYRIEAPLLAPTPPTPAEIQAKEARDASAAKGAGIRAEMEEREDYARRFRAMLSDARACRKEGIPIDRAFLNELCDRHRIPHSAFAGATGFDDESVLTASQRDAQVAILSREVTPPAEQGTGITESELEACRAEDCSPEAFLAVRHARRAREAP